MGHSHEFVTKDRLLHIRYDGVLTDDVLMQGYREDQQAIRKYRPTAVILNLSNLRQVDVKTETNLQLAQDPSFPAEVRLVFVAPRDAQLRISRMFKTSATPELAARVQVVRGVSDAYAALRLKEPPRTEFYWEFAAAERVLAVRYQGLVNDQGMIDSYWETAKVVDLCDPAVAVADLSAATHFDVRPDAVRSLADHPSYFKESHRRYVIAPSDIQYGMARMFQILGEATRRELKIVRSWADLYETLGIAREPLFERVTLPEEETEPPARSAPPAS